jgi:N-acetylmuramoyl-L-alanine amidase/putative methionine-R-sulfoxide reductase with GAF domain
MATISTKPDIDVKSPSGASGWTKADSSAIPTSISDSAVKPSQRDALQALLAFSSLHEQLRRRKALASRPAPFDSLTPVAEFEPSEQFILDEVLQLVAERAVSITGADGIAIALAENNEIVLRAAAGTIRPDLGARIDRDSAFSGACFRTAQVINCDDTEVDSRVNLEACRKLGARSMVAVPLCGRRRVIGVLEAFSSWPFGFNDSDVRNLTLLAELVLAALKPEDEDRFAQSAQIAATKLEDPKTPVKAPPKADPPKPVAVVGAEPQKAPVVAAPESLKAAPAPAKLEVPKPVPAPGSGEPAKAAIAPPGPPESSKPVIAASTLKIAPDVPKTPAAVTAPAKPSATIPPAPLGSVPVPPKTSLPIDSAGKKVEAPPTQTTASRAPAKAEATAPLVEKVASPPEPAPGALEGIAPTAATEPQLTFGQPQTEEPSSKPWLLILLVWIVVAAAFAVGVWWKLNSAKLGSQIVHNQPAAQSANPSPENKSASAAAAANAAPAPPTSADSDTDNEPDDSPASPQELAKFPRVTGVRHWSSADSSTVVLDLEDQVQYEPGHLVNPDRVYFDLRGTQLAPELQGKSLDGDTLLSRIRIAQPIPGMTRIVLEARGTTTLATPRVSLERDPYRLVIQVSKTGVTPKASVDLFPHAVETEKNKLAIVIPPPSKEDLQLRGRVPKMRIAVDAGHGGWDLGTVGRRGMLEKDLVLEISERLGQLLASRLGADVIYTRPDDNYVPLDQRAIIANQAQADLFISVHANHSDLPTARGVETYYTNFFSAPGSKDYSNPAGPKEAAMRSAAPKNVPMPTLTADELHERIEQSRRLATSVQRSLYGALSLQNPGLPDRGIREAGFVVLTESAMPGILAEVSFVSSPTDEQKLRSDGYREQIAEALYRGIARYAITAKGVKMASAAK